MIRISRLDYNKPHRCPTWSGGGWRGGKRDDCNASFAPFIYCRRAWPWKFTRCQECRVVCLPHVTRWLDPTWWWWYLGQRRKIYGLWPYSNR